MQGRQGYTLQALRAVQKFLDANPDKFSRLAGSGARRKLDEQVAALDAYVATQGGSDLAAQGATQLLYARRRDLVQDHMLPIARIAAAELSQAPNLLSLKMPKGNASTEMLHAAAQAMADAAEPFADVFIDALLPPDFIEQLRAAADAMRAPLDARTQNRGLRSGATAGLKVTMESALKTVRVLDAAVRIALKGDPGMLTTWNAVKRVPAKTRTATAVAQESVELSGAADTPHQIAPLAAMVEPRPVPERGGWLEFDRTTRFPLRVGGASGTDFLDALLGPACVKGETEGGAGGQAIARVRAS